MISNIELIKNGMITWIERIVFYQLYLVAFLAVLTIGLMSFRKKRERRLENLKSEYADLFINELLNQGDATPPLLLKRPSKYKWLAEAALQETLLTQINSLSGSEKTYAVKRYIELNYAKDDIELCISLRWWKRLEGISHLNTLKESSFARVFNYMRKDSNALISLYSLLGLSSLRHPFNTPKLFDTLGEKVHPQDNILLEITQNWSNLFGLEPLVEFIQRTPSVELRNTFVAAICQLKTPESAAVIAGFLHQTSKPFSADLIAEMIHSLRDLADIDMQPYLQHESELVRQRALEFVTGSFGVIPAHLIEAIRLDPSPGVRRIYEEWAERSAA